MRTYRTVKLTTIIFIGLTLAQCALAPSQKIDDSRISYPQLLPQDFPKEIARLEEVAKTHSDSTERAKAQLELAVLLSYYKNPSPDYIRALKELETYIALNPDRGRADEIQNLLAALKKIELLTKENNKIKEENQKVKEMIENIKSLDIQIEQKRKKY